MRFFFLLLCVQLYVHAQHNLEVYISSIPPNQEDFHLEFHIFSEDHFELVHTEKVIVKDTFAEINLSIQSDTVVRFYQLKVADSPNIMEFLLSPHEKMTISGPLYDLLNGALGVENSVENTAYSRLLNILNEYEQIMSVLEEESATYSVYDHDFNAKVNSHTALIEEVQHKLNLNLEKIEITFPETYTAQILIPLSKIPVRSYRKEWIGYYDGYMSFLHDFFFYFLPVNDSRMLNHYAFQDKLFQYLNEYVEKEQTATENAIGALLEVFSGNAAIKSFVYSQLMKTYIQLDSEYFVNYLIENYGGGCGLELSFEELKKMNQITATNIGANAPDILLYDLQNQAKSLKNTIENNDFTVVVFWVGWCEHCKKEMPELINLASEFKKSIGFFAVSLDADESKWKEAASVYSFPKNWVNVCEKVAIEKSTYAPLYNISTTPSIFLLNSEGKIVAKKLKVEELREYLKNN